MTGVAPKIPESLVGTSTRTKAKRTKAKHKTLPELLDACPVIQRTNVDPYVVPATLGSEEVMALTPPAVCTVGQESAADFPAKIEDATAQLP